MLPPDAAPTIFQVATLLSNDSWREAVLFPPVPGVLDPPVPPAGHRGHHPGHEPHRPAPVLGSGDRAPRGLPVELRRPPGHGPGDGGPGLPGRQRGQGPAGGQLPGLRRPPGRPVPQGHPPGGPPTVLRVLRRGPDLRRGLSGEPAALLEQAAKYGVRAFLLNQNPERLTPATFDAVTTNCFSHLAATVVNARAASIIAREWGGAGLARRPDPAGGVEYLTTHDGAAPRGQDGLGRGLRWAAAARGAAPMRGAREASRGGRH